MVQSCLFSSLSRSVRVARESGSREEILILDAYANEDLETA